MSQLSEPRVKYWKLIANLAEALDRFFVYLE